MLVTFKTRSYANITMFGDVAKIMLVAMDFGDVVPGAIVARDVARALKNLHSSLESELDITPPAVDNDDDQPAVSLRTRAIPLIELLQSAVKDDNDIMWE